MGTAPVSVASGVCLTIFAANYKVPTGAFCSGEFSMFITPAFAQAGGAAQGPSLIVSLLPFILIFVIMYFLIIRPQRQQMKKRQEMLDAVRRNDTVVTGGGVVGKVTKVFEDEGELEVEIAKDTRVRIVRSMVADVRVKGEPVAANDAK